MIAEVFRRPIAQVMTGVLLGSALMAGLVLAAKGRLGAEILALLIGWAVVMLGVCALACVVPMLRALRVEPTEALAAEL